MTAAAVIGFVIDAMRKIESRAIGGPPNASAPTTATSTSPPRTTAPGNAPARTCPKRTSLNSATPEQTTYDNQTHRQAAEQRGTCTTRARRNRTQGERNATQPPVRTELERTNAW